MVNTAVEINTDTAYYRLSELINDNLTHSQAIIANQELPQILGVRKAMYYRYLGKQIGDTAPDMKVSQLIAVFHYFRKLNVVFHLDDMINNVVFQDKEKSSVELG